jgi:3-phenylpropionate/cinnamic acid dioxygenase small subunit
LSGWGKFGVSLYNDRKGWRDARGVGWRIVPREIVLEEASLVNQIIGEGNFVSL